jgi:hypothetical protein
VPRDIYKPEGRLDRVKVFERLDRLLPESLSDDRREAVEGLFTEALEAAYSDGYNDCQDIA